MYEFTVEKPVGRRARTDTSRPVRTRLGHLLLLLSALAVAALAAVPSPAAGAWRLVKPSRCQPRPAAARHARHRRRCRGSGGGTPAASQPAPAGPWPAARAAATASAPPPSPSPPGEPFRFYSPSSFWNTPAPADAPLDPDSGPIVAAFDSLVESEFQARTGPAINTTEYSAPIYTVPESQPTVKVTLDATNAPALQEAWNAVPIPDDARPAVGTDGRLVVWQPSTDKLWDFWRAKREEDGWHAKWGGATQNVSSASGLPDAASWPGAQPWWGTSGCSLGIVGGLITIEDLEMGVVNHALQIGIPNVRAKVYASPALRTDGKAEDPLALPEGAHLRLDPDLDLEALNLPRATLIIARAAQRYGIYVTNGGGDVSFQAEDPTPTGAEPYRGPDGFWQGSYPRALLSRFPWSDLQLLQMELHG
jgi:hypothetical protein